MGLLGGHREQVDAGAVVKRSELGFGEQEPFLAIDYSIHVSDRFAREVARGHEPAAALRLAATGTGGVVLGSALDSGSTVATLLFHPSSTRSAPSSCSRWCSRS